MMTIREIARAFGGQGAMAEAINAANEDLGASCTRGMVEKWAQFNSVPGKWIAPLVIAARQNGIQDVTADLLCDINMESMRCKRGDQNEGAAA